MISSGWVSVKDSLPKKGQIVDIWATLRDDRFDLVMSLKGTDYARNYFHETDYTGWRITNCMFVEEYDEQGLTNCFIKCTEKYLRPKDGRNFELFCVENGEVKYWMPLPENPK